MSVDRTPGLGSQGGFPMTPMTQVIITERGKVRTTWVPTATLIGLPLAPKEAGQ